MNKNKILGIIRHVLTTAGGWAVGQGYVDADLMLEIVGGVAAIVGVAWSYFSPEKKTD